MCPPQTQRTSNFFFTKYCIVFPRNMNSECNDAAAKRVKKGLQKLT
jgi:hypothetical protein